MQATPPLHDHRLGGRHDHEPPSSGRALTGIAVSATLHCLTGCALGEVAGMAIGTVLGFSNWGTVALAVGLAFLFGYSLTSLPLLRAGLGAAVVIPIAVASDTFSIAVMELVDNAIVLAVPGAMEAGLSSLLFWGSLSFALAVAFVAAVPVNRWLIARGKGHAAVHRTGVHGGPPPRLVGAIVAGAFAFGAAVLIAEALDDDGTATNAGVAYDRGRSSASGSGHPAASRNISSIAAAAGARYCGTCRAAMILRDTGSPASGRRVTPDGGRRRARLGISATPAPAATSS